MDVVRPRFVDEWTEEEQATAIAAEKIKAKEALVAFLVGKEFQSTWHRRSTRC